VSLHAFHPHLHANVLDEAEGTRTAESLNEVEKTQNFVQASNVPFVHMHAVAVAVAVVDTADMDCCWNNWARFASAFVANVVASALVVASASPLALVVAACHCYDENA